MNETCYRRIDDLILNGLYVNPDEVTICLEDLYEYFVNYGYVFTSYQFEQFEIDLFHLLDDADYTYTISFGHNMLTLITIEMDY